MPFPLRPSHPLREPLPFGFRPSDFGFHPFLRSLCYLLLKILVPIFVSANLSVYSSVLLRFLSSLLFSLPRHSSICSFHPPLKMSAPDKLFRPIYIGGSVICSLLLFDNLI